MSPLYLPYISTDNMSAEI
jgi:hypothetical protein